MARIALVILTTLALSACGGLLQPASYPLVGKPASGGNGG
jgi:hypothetical protein